MHTLDLPMRAGMGTGRPQRSATWRAMYGASAELADRTFPMQTELKASGAKPLASIAAWEARTCGPEMYVLLQLIYQYIIIQIIC